MNRRVWLSLVAITVFALLSQSSFAQRLPPPPDPGSPVILVPVDLFLDGPYTNGNSLLDPGQTHAFGYTQQQLSRGDWIEGWLTAHPNDGAELGVVPPGAVSYLRQRATGWPSNTFYSGIEFRDTNADGMNELTIYHGYGGPQLPPVVYNSGNLPGNPRTVKVRIAVSNKLYYYLDYKDRDSVPLYTSPDLPPVPLAGFAICITINAAGCHIEDILKGRTLLVQ